MWLPPTTVLCTEPSARTRSIPELAERTCTRSTRYHSMRQPGDTSHTWRAAGPDCPIKTDPRTQMTRRSSAGGRPPSRPFGTHQSEWSWNPPCWSHPMGDPLDLAYAAGPRGVQYRRVETLAPTSRSARATASAIRVVIRPSSVLIPRTGSGQLRRAGYSGLATAGFPS